MARILLEAAAGSGPPADSINSDMILILAGLLCALVCVLGLGLVARCACSWRWAAASRSQPAADDATKAANRGVKKEVLRSLPTVTYVPDSGKAKAKAAAGGADECAICLAEFEEGQAMRVLPQCAHAFHAACVDTWLRAHSSCPSCRRVLAAPADLPPGEPCRRCGARPGFRALWKAPAPCSAEGPTFLA